ncbi:MAG: hypothetical protein KTR35_07550 [Gammaproteobacteria bacterium]|nr:hypothetical protein [Gammaproteobacteria bacterium]
MSTLLDADKLTEIVDGYFTGSSDALKDATILRGVRMRRRQLSRMMRAYDPALAQKKLPEGDYHISKKIDGEFTCIVYQYGEVFTVNPGGTVRLGAAVHHEVQSVLDSAGVKSAILGAELYVRRPDGERPRVHDVVQVARAPKHKEDVDTLCLGVFNIYELDDEDLSMRYSTALEKIQSLFGSSDRVHGVETSTGDKKQVFELFDQWVNNDNEEGLVLRSDSLGVYKLKRKHNLDLAVIGYSTGTDDRADMLHSLLLAIARADGTFQIVARCGGGFSDDDRMKLLKPLSKLHADSDYMEVNSDKVAYQMIQPGLVAEITCLDVVARTSHGNTIDKMVLEWSSTESWNGLRRLPLCSILSPQFVRLRDDKEPNAEDIHLSQLSDITDIPESTRTAIDIELPKSTIIAREVATKELKGNTMVRKLLLWKTNKEDHSNDYPAYVLHLTDFSPNRKTPLNHEICVSNSEEQITDLLSVWQKKYFVRGWKTIE